MFLGLKIEMPEFDKLREEAGLSPIETPHITTTHMWRRVYERRFKADVGRSSGQVDIYRKDWSQGREARTEDWIERSGQGQVDRSKKRMKQDRLNKERVEAWRQGQSLIVVATTERSQRKVVWGGLNKHKKQSMAVEEKLVVRSNRGSRQRAGCRTD